MIHDFPLIDPYLVYTIILGTPRIEFNKVIVDPGTGQILASQEISQKEWMKMQQMGEMMHSDGHSIDLESPAASMHSELEQVVS